MRGETDPRRRLAELVHQVGRHRSAIREFALAGYATMVEQHQDRLAEVREQIRRLCSDHELELPPEAQDR